MVKPELEGCLAELGGEAGVARWMALFYEKVGAHPLLAPLFTDLEISRDKQTDYMVEFLGGPARYSEKHGKAFLRFKHRHITIGEPERDAWFNLFMESLRETTRHQPTIAALEAAVATLATAMINHHPEKKDAYFFN